MVGLAAALLHVAVVPRDTGAIGRGVDGDDLALQISELCLNGVYGLLAGAVLISHLGLELVDIVVHDGKRDAHREQAHHREGDSGIADQVVGSDLGVGLFDNLLLLHYSLFG